jgi:DNA-binding NarL/FixJ family response regulator
LITSPQSLAPRISPDCKFFSDVSPKRDSLAGKDLIVWDNLTDSELTVVRLTAEGATNRFIAGQLHLPHTR